MRARLAPLPALAAQLPLLALLARAALGQASITSISPNSATAGDPAFTLTVNGAGFTALSSVLWNGSARATTFVSVGRLTASIPASDVAAAGTASVTVNDPLGNSNAVTFTINPGPPPNPVPSIGSISPTSAAAGSPGFTLTVNGSNFVAASAVQWNGAARATTFVNAGQVAASIPASDVAVPGSASVTVFNPAPGGGASNAATFTINVAPNPVPSISALTPASAAAGSGGFTLTVDGANFVASSVVQWNGAARATTFVSATRLTATVLAADVASAGTASVTVFNPAPGGGASNAASFAIAGPGGPPVAAPSPRAYPNPAGKNGSVVTFDRLAPGSEVKVLTASGRKVKTLSAPSGIATWDLTNDSSERVASGIYVYLVAGPGGKSHGILAVVR